MGKAPLVSVGLPVFNGEPFLAETLASLRGQTEADFELIVSDNASTDRTAEICRDVAAEDPRIRYIRQKRNIGAPANWNFVAREARGRFFKWSSASDVCVPQFLETCVRALMDDPEVVLCFGRTAYIDENGNPVSMPQTDDQTLEARPSARFIHVCSSLGLNNQQYGVLRRDVLMRTRLDRSYPHGDLVLMAELALLGKFKLVPETLLLRRAALGHLTRLMSAEQVDAMFWPDGKPRYANENLVRHLDYLRAALTAPVPWGERMRAAAYSLRSAYWRKAHIARELFGPRAVRVPQAGPVLSQSQQRSDEPSS